MFAFYYRMIAFFSLNWAGKLLLILRITIETVKTKTTFRPFFSLFSPLAVAQIVNSQSTYIPRVAQCLSFRPHWDTPPLPQASVSLPEPKGGGTHSPAGEGMAGTRFGRLRKRLALCLLCVLIAATHRENCQKKRLS
jgi:hypothetical protein